MILRLADVADDLRAGRKAQTLARLRAVGLPVLDGLVLPAGEEVAAFDPSALGPGPFVVRSSSALEDGERGSAAGLYLSLRGVEVPALAEAIARVRASAEGEEVVAYLTARGLTPRPIAVLVQADVGAVTLGVARSTLDGFLTEERSAATPEWGDTSAGMLARDAHDPLVALLARTEQLLGVPVDVEYARRDEGLVLLQARPIARAVAPHSTTQLPPGRWRFDAAHNPDPISAAQADLVARVDGARFGARARVIDGYLYVREDAASLARLESSGDALARYTERVEPAMRAELAAAAGAPLPTAIEVYVRMVRHHAREIRPSLSAARGALDDLLRRELGEPSADQPSLLGGSGGATLERDAALYALGRADDEATRTDYLARFGAYAQVWDVAAPCDDEDLPRLWSAAQRRARGPDPGARAASARAAAEHAAEAIRRRLPARARGELDRALGRLRSLVSLGESDDRVFFEGQRLVRRALLVRARELVAAGDLGAVEDVFDLPLAIAQRGGDARAQAAAGREARRRSARALPPFRIVDRVPQVRLPASSEILHGRGIGGRGRGRAWVIASLDQSLDDVPEGAVLVLATALPSLAPHLPRLAGLVTEHGGALGHAATLAREIGLPAVVGVAGALRIPQATPLYIDGERGRVLLLRGGEVV